MNVNCRYCISDHCGLCVDPTCLCRQSHNKTELLNAFTETARKFLPSSVEELKQVLRKGIEEEKEELEGNFRNKFEIYEEANNNYAFASNFESDIMLPGHYFKGKDSCGQWKVLGCKDHEGGYGFVRKTEQHCNHRGCNTCWTNAVKREAGSITNRMVSFASLKNNHGVYQNKTRKRVLLPLIVSLPQDKHYLIKTREGRKKARGLILKALKKLDIDGGVMIDHPYRFNEARTKGYLSPHFHFIVTGWIDGKIVSKINQETGLIIKNSKPLKSAKNVYGMSEYLLSHSAVYMKQLEKRSPEHSIRYFGECQNRKFKVDEVLKYSKSGYDQLDELMKNKHSIERKIEGQRVTLQLQKVTYSYSTIEDEIKEARNELFFENCYGNTISLNKALREYITPLMDHKDNPAFCESEPFSFLQLRFDYGYSPYDIVQSEYSSIILDTNLDELCPECSQKMLVLVPLDRGGANTHLTKIAELVKSLPLDITLPLDDIGSMFAYRRDQLITYKGLEYFDLEGMRQYDNGIYSKPECLSSLNPGLYFNIETELEIQTFKNAVKVGLSRGMTYEERTSMNNDVKDFIKMKLSKKSAYHKPLECYN